MSYQIPEIPRCSFCGRIAEVEVRLPDSDDVNHVCPSCMDEQVGREWWLLMLPSGFHYIADTKVASDKAVLGPVSFKEAWIRMLAIGDE